MELVFVRHGQPEWVRDGAPQMDPVLTPLGQLQAARVAERLAKRGAAHVWCSPSTRTRQTAAPFTAHTGKEVTIVDDLLEIRLPDLSLAPPHSIAEVFREARNRPPSAWWDGIPGGEDFRGFERRVRTALEAQLATLGVTVADTEHAQFHVPEGIGRVIVFGHGGTNAVAMTALLGLHTVPWEWERFTLSHTGLLRLKAVPLGGSHIFSVRSFNDCEHLEKAQRTA